VGVVRSIMSLLWPDLRTPILTFPLSGGRDSVVKYYDDLRTRRYHSHSKRTCLAV
jgi:hypothetical protein